jgi:hypothetical protein
MKVSVHEQHRGGASRPPSPPINASYHPITAGIPRPLATGWLHTRLRDALP